MKQAYQDVKNIDDEHPLMIRMNGWYFYDYDEDFFRGGNPFGSDVADIVMLNAYSNVDDYYDDFVQTVVSRARTHVEKFTYDVELIISLGGWEEPPLWYKPSIEHFMHDYEAAILYAEPVAIAIFKYGALGEDWWMPDNNKELWDLLVDL